VVEPVPALRPGGLAHGERDAGAGLLPVRALLPRAHAGRARGGGRRPAAAHARHRCAAPGAARRRGARAAAAVARVRPARRVLRAVPVARGSGDGLPGRALQARGEAHAAMAMTLAAVRGSFARARTAAWLGWQVEGNWVDPMLFAIYVLARP